MGKEGEEGGNLDKGKKGGVINRQEMIRRVQ